MSNESIIIILFIVLVVFVAFRITGYYLDPKEKVKRQIEKISHSRIIILYAWYNSLGSYIIDNEDKWMWELLVDERERRLKHNRHYWDYASGYLFSMRLFLSSFGLGNGGINSILSTLPILISLDFPSAAWSCEKLGMELSIDDYARMRLNSSSLTPGTEVEKVGTGLQAGD